MRYNQFTTAGAQVYHNARTAAAPPRCVTTEAEDTSDGYYFFQSRTGHRIYHSA